MKFAHLIFDFDGTLVDSRNDIADAQLYALAHLGVTHFRREDLFPHIGKSLEVTFTRLLPPSLHRRIPEAARLYAEYYRPRALKSTRLFHGVQETLETLHGMGIGLAVASTKRGDGILRATEHFGITHLFAQLQGSDGIPFKPAPDVIHRVLEGQGWSPQRTLMVGDTDVDILAGKAAGVATCAVTYGSLNEEELRQYEPDYVIAAFPLILSVLSGVA
jgi:HAD superfamily hydrolase (TIGR01509 family)